MGQGYSYRCEHCDYTLEYMQGVGFLFPLEAEKILTDILAGKMGKRFQAAATAAEAPEVNHSRELYKCESCGELRPNMKIELRDGEKLLLAKQHRCGKCRGKMHIAKSKKLKCPHCGKALVIGNMIMWD